MMVVMSVVSHLFFHYTPTKTTELSPLCPLVRFEENNATFVCEYRRCANNSNDVFHLMSEGAFRFFLEHPRLASDSLDFVGGMTRLALWCAVLVGSSQPRAMMRLPMFYLLAAATFLLSDLTPVHALDILNKEEGGQSLRLDFLFVPLQHKQYCGLTVILFYLSTATLRTALTQFQFKRRCDPVHVLDGLCWFYTLTAVPFLLCVRWIYTSVVVLAVGFAFLFYH